MKDTKSNLPHSITKDNADRIIKTMHPNEIYAVLSEFFKIFGDLTRLRILNLLMKSEMCVHDMSYFLDMTQTSISHQLRVLRKERIVKFRKEGKHVYYSLNDEHIGDIFNTGIAHISE